MKQLTKKSFLILFLGLVVLFTGCSQGENHNYIKTPEEFIAAINRGDSVIYVDDISFKEETAITLNHAVQINGKNNKSKIENACFFLEGTLTVTEYTTYAFNNVIFDGKVDESAYDFLTPDKTFYEIFGNSNRSDKKCFQSVSGYMNLTLNNCEIMRYASYDAPAIAIDNPELYCKSERYLNMNNCYIHNNICYEAIAKIYHDKAVTNITNTTFSDNLCKNTGSIAVSNGTGTIDNIKVINNRYYHFVYNGPDGTPMFPNDKLTVGGNEYNYVSFSGSLYLGGSNIVVTNSLISDNKTLFGGGIGFSTPQASTENQKMLFKNLTIRNNEAKYGGAIYAKCGSGHTARFINCSIQNNKAEYGSFLYVTTLIPWIQSKIGGSLNFVFSSIVRNNSTNNKNNFEFSETTAEEQKGIINVLGCFIVDNNSSYPPSENNYIETEETAIKDNVVSKDKLDRANKENIYPNNGSKGDILIKAETYKTWDEIYTDAKTDRSIGFIEEVAPSKTPLILSIVIPVVVVLIVAFIIILVAYKKRKTEIENRNIDTKLASYDFDDLLKISEEALSKYNLTKKEIDVAACLLICNRRKEIADRLFVSEDTVKTHISHIYKKMKINSKNELKKIINQRL